MDPLMLGILSSLIATCIGFVAVFVLNRLSAYFRVRRIWGTYTVDFTLISGQIYFQQHDHRYMAAGDIKSILSITLILRNMFKIKRVPHRFSDASMENAEIKGNIIAIGGPKFNTVTRALLDHYNNEIQGFPVRFENNKILIEWYLEDRVMHKEEVSYIKKDGAIVEDYGLLIRGFNPFDGTRSTVAWIVAGSGSNGCLAAAEQLSKFTRGFGAYHRKLRKYLARGQIGIAVVKSIFLEGEYVTSIPVAFAVYQEKRRFGILGKKEKRWNFRIELSPKDATNKS